MFCIVIINNEVLIIVLWFLNGSYYYLNFSFSKKGSFLFNIIIIGKDIDFIENFDFGDIICFFWFYVYGSEKLIF